MNNDNFPEGVRPVDALEKWAKSSSISHLTKPPSCWQHDCEVCGIETPAGWGSSKHAKCQGWFRKGKTGKELERYREIRWRAHLEGKFKEEVNERKSTDGFCFNTGCWNFAHRLEEYDGVDFLTRAMYIKKMRRPEYPLDIRFCDSCWEHIRTKVRSEVAIASSRAG